MKTRILIGLLLIATCCISCNKDVKKITGDYSYKLSGVVNFEDADGNQASILATKR